MCEARPIIVVVSRTKCQLIIIHVPLYVCETSLYCNHGDLFCSICLRNGSIACNETCTSKYIVTVTALLCVYTMSYTTVAIVVQSLY